MNKFAKKIVIVEPTVAAVTKKDWRKKKGSPKKRERFTREFIREVKFPKEAAQTYVWVFTEYKKPDMIVPQYRLKEDKFVVEGRHRIPIMGCPVVWEIDMQVRIEAYAAYQTFLGAEAK